MTTVLVIQARMGSTRFPGKAMAPLAGLPVITHVMRRALRASLVDRVMLATTTLPADDTLASAAGDEGIFVVRGSSEDVLSRFRIAAEEAAADVVVRVTGDCPLLDPRLVDRVVGLLARESADYASNVSPPSYPDGYDVEALTVDCLQRLDATASLTHEREHVTARIREHPGEFQTAHIRCRVDYSWMRLTVDIPDDLARVNAILTAAGSIDVGLGGVLAIMRNRSDLSDMRGAPGRDERYRTQVQAASAVMGRVRDA